MALTIRRWAVLAGLGCAVIALASWPTAGYQDPSLMLTGRSATDFARWNLSEAGAALAVLERRDSLLRASRAAQSGEVSVVFDTMVPLPARSGLATAIRSALTASRGSDVRVVVFISRRTNTRLGREASDFAMLSDFWYFLPVATDGRTCLVLAYPDGARMPTLVETNDDTNLEDWAQHIASPCVWYHAFGETGPGVEQWLRSTGYSYAREPDRARPRPRLGEHRIGQNGPPDIGGLLALLFGHVSEFEVPIPVRACAHDDLDICRDLVHPRPRRRSWRTPFGPSASVARQPEPAWNRDELTWFLADLHREIGDARFSSFWTSPAPVDSAFRMATGSSMERWTQRWLLSRMTHPLFGPTPTIAALTLGAALLGLSIGAACVFAIRRQVG